MSEPRRLGDRYELGETLGRGGMAEVVEGRDLRLGRRVAVKLLRPDLAKDPSFQARFRREAQSAASLNHPNIVAVYDTGEDTLDTPEGQVVPYIVMEYVDGMTLRQLQASGRRLLPERALEITAGILAALDYSHRHGIIHRDIKPANVMLTRGGDVKVMDFGIARATAEAHSTMTQGSAVMGTAQYLSPEQARGEIVDARSDLYSTGCLLFELLTGRPPFVGESPVSVAYQHVSEQAPTPSQIDPTVPRTIDPLVMKALAKNTSERYQTAAEFRGDVERAIAGMPVSATAPVAAAASTQVIPNANATQVLSPINAQPNTSPIATVEQQPKKRSPWVWIGALAALAAVAAGAWLLGSTMFGGGGGPKVTVPDLVGLTVPQAQRALAEQGLVLGQQDAEVSEEPQDQIIKQDPTAGSQLEKGQAVAITVSAGAEQTQVPNLQSMTNLDDVRTALSDAQLRLGSVTERDSSQPKGYVLSQTPSSGSKVDIDTKVDVVISSGRVSVPDVVTQSQSQATNTLTDAGFQVSVVNQPGGSAGQVVSQNPPPGTSLAKGSTVTITVSSGGGPTPTQSPLSRAEEPTDPNGDPNSGREAPGPVPS